MRRSVAAMLILVTACSGTGDGSGIGTEGTLEPTTPVPTTSGDAAPSDPSSTEPTTTTIVTGNARFVIGDVVFGDRGSIEVGNLGPDAGDLTGFWLAVHPYYLEIPPTVLAPGTAIVVSVNVDADPTIVIPAFGLLPALDPDSGEIGLYRTGEFGDPSAIVDYVEWGPSGHTRTLVAVEAELWPEEGSISVDSSATGLTADNRSVPGPQGWVPTFG